MSSTTLGTFCCVASGSHQDIQTILNLNSEYYNGVCLFTTTVGIMGVILQFLPNIERCRGERRTLLSIGRQKKILCSLAFADLFALIGIIIRSIAWLADKTIISDHPRTGLSGHWFCGVVFAWIHYFYAATYFWTLCYAIDVFNTTRQKMGHVKIYHAISWGIPAILTLCAVVSLYVPEFRCHDGYERALVSYLLSYIPILLVMTLNPILYVMSSTRVKSLLANCNGQFSDYERHLLRNLERKYFLIVLVFFICWLPNILNGIILWTMWEDLPRNIILTVWYVMAMVNPLQAFLNAMVYRGRNMSFFMLTSFCRNIMHPPVAGEVDPAEAEATVQGDCRQLIE